MLNGCRNKIYSNPHKTLSEFFVRLQIMKSNHHGEMAMRAFTYIVEIYVNPNKKLFTERHVQCSIVKLMCAIEIKVKHLQTTLDGPR